MTAPTPHPESLPALILEPCQFCGAPAEQVDAVDAPSVSRKSGRDHWIYCRECKAGGPIEKSLEAAMRSWNHGKEVKRS